MKWESSVLQLNSACESNSRISSSSSSSNELASFSIVYVRTCVCMQCVSYFHFFSVHFFVAVAVVVVFHLVSLFSYFYTRKREICIQYSSIQSNTSEAYTSHKYTQTTHFMQYAQIRIEYYHIRIHLAPHTSNEYIHMNGENLHCDGSQKHARVQLSSYIQTTVWIEYIDIYGIEHSTYTSNERTPTQMHACYAIYKMNMYIYTQPKQIEWDASTSGENSQQNCVSK